MREQQPIKLFCSNVRGLVCNWHNACSFDWEQYNLLAFNEVWNIRDFENLVRDGYEVKTVKLRQLTRGRGMIIFVKKNLQVTVTEGCLETTCIKIGKILFINIYRPPSGNIDMFLDSLTQFLNTQRFDNIISLEEISILT